MIQSAGPSPALLDRLKNAADLMEIREEVEEKDTVKLSVGTKAKTRRASYLWAMLIARIYEALPGAAS